MKLWQKKKILLNSNSCVSVLLVNCSQRFEASTGKIIAQANDLHLSVWRTFWAPNESELQLRCKGSHFSKVAGRTANRLYSPNSPPGQKLPLLGKPIKLNSEDAFPGSSNGVWPRKCLVFRRGAHPWGAAGLHLRSLQADRDADEHTDLSS